MGELPGILTVTIHCRCPLLVSYYLILLSISQPLSDIVKITIYCPFVV